MNRIFRSIALMSLLGGALFGQDEAEQAATAAFDSLSGVEAPANVEATATGIEHIVRGMSVESTKYEAAGIVNVANDNVIGAQFGLGVNVVNGDMRGVQMAIGGNFSEAMPSGAQFSSLINVTGEVGHGAQFAGVLNAVSGNAGAQFAGVVNLSGGDATFQSAGVINISGKNVFAQAAGAVNIAGGDVKLVQMAGAVNISPGNVGAQFAGAVNIADGEVGAQFAPFNMATGPVGLQVGVVNFADAGVGLPIGIINVVTGVPWRLSFRGDDLGGGQVALKTGNDYFYTMLGLTAPELSVEDRPNFISGIGVRLPLGNRLYVESDFLIVSDVFNHQRNEQFVHNFGNNRWIDKKFQDYHVEDQFRIQAGFRFLPFLGVSGGVNYHAPRLIENWKFHTPTVNYQIGLELFLSPPKMGRMGLDKIW